MGGRTSSRPGGSTWNSYGLSKRNRPCRVRSKQDTDGESMKHQQHHRVIFYNIVFFSDFFFTIVVPYYKLYTTAVTDDVFLYSYCDHRTLLLSCPTAAMMALKTPRKPNFALFYFFRLVFGWSRISYLHTGCWRGFFFFGFLDLCFCCLQRNI